MKYRIIEDLSAQETERYQVQHSIFGHTWALDAAFPDQISAEIHMEQLAVPRVVASFET